ncbi:unnamed protein product [Coregonus sp. 'balchen']|nr:unnamed protein product [Coregonus sp. 'balchen']
MALYEYVSRDQLSGFDKYKVMPRWLAPNLITFTGFMFLARRTNSSTPLGELFDHGLDSWACVFFVATVYSIFGRGESGVGVATLYYILWVTWYEPIWWNFHYRDLFTFMILGCSFTVTLPMSLYNVFKASRSNTLKHSSMYEAFLPFLSPVLLFLLSSAWVIFSPSDILQQQPRVFYLMCKLIVCQMSNTRCQPLSWLLVPMATVVLLAVTGLVANETLLIYVWTAIVILTHIHYGVSVVNQLSDHFNIFAFSLMKPSTD